MSQYKEHAESEVSSIEASKMHIANYLRRNARGKDNPVPGSELAELVPQKRTTVYDMIPEIRVDYGIPVVGSKGRGYYIIEDVDELDRKVEQMNNTIQTTEQRKQDLVRAFNGVRYDD